MGKSVAKSAIAVRRVPRVSSFLACAAVLFATQAQAQTRPLNDTGIDFCGAYPSGNNKPCLGTEPVGQDAHYGRDAQAAAGTLTKIGGGNAGFDFTALDANGNPTTPSSGTNPHSCVRDNVTGLIWEVKTDDGGLHDKDWTYSWYDSTSPDGNPGLSSGGYCFQTGRCDTEKFVQDVNNAGWCGNKNWRMPTVKELAGIVDLGRYNPSIDPVYFPNSIGERYWSGSPYAYFANNISNTDSAWYVYFRYGDTTAYSRINGFLVRLVNDGTAVLSPPALSASPRIVTTGNDTLLTWDTNNGNEALCSLTANSQTVYAQLPAGGDPETGSVSLAVPVRTTYVLTCPHGTDWVTVEVQSSGGET